MDANNPSGAFVLLAVAWSLAVVLGLRKFRPDRPRIAMLLAILFGPCGHLYLPGSLRYIALMYLGWAGLIVFTPLPLGVSMILLSVLSVLLMNARLQQAAAAVKAAKHDGPA